MGALTEVEIFSCMSENFRLAAQHSERLAQHVRKGPAYKSLRDELKLIGGAARQAAAWREDARWLLIDKAVTAAHKMAGDWLRGFKREDGVRIKLAPSEIKARFLILAEFLRKTAHDAEALKNKATGKAGMILPNVASVGRNVSHVPVQLPPGMMATRSGLIVPAGTVLQ